MPGALPTASPPILTPGTASAHFNYEVWQRGVEPATYQKQLFVPRVDETERPYSKGHIRKHARVGINTMGSSDVGTGLLYQNPVGTEVTLTPAGNYVAVGWSENEDAMSDVPLDSDLADQMEMALAEGTDQVVMANIPALTNFRGGAGANYDTAMHRNALALIQRNTNGWVVAGQTTIYGILDVAQYPYIMGIPEFTNADIRGDAENPQVKGIWSKGGGVMMMLTTVATEDGNGVHGCMWVPSAFVVGWNVRTRTKRQDLELQNRLILYNNLGSTIKHDARAVGLRTDNTIPA